MMHDPSFTSTGAAGYCGMHGHYVGFQCPACSSSAIPAAPATRLDPSAPGAPLDRIADSLSRIAAALERLAP